LSKLGYRADIASNGLEAVEAIERQKYDVVLMDVMMPEMDGYEVCRKIKENTDTKDIPIIFITAKTDENSIEKAYDIGGIDYVTKPFKPKELLAKVKRELYLQDTKKELKLLASTDSMTKLYNRRYFTKMAEHSLDLSKRENKDLSIIMMDIDKFKNVNDTYGHQVGDDVIITLANKLLKYQRKSDIVCRYGGDEFVIIFNRMNMNQVKSIIQRIVKKIESTLLKYKDDLIKITISIGLTRHKKGDTFEELLKRADYALYQAKVKRNGYEIKE